MRPKTDRVTDCIAFAINTNAPPPAEWLGEGNNGFAMFSAGDAAELLIAAAETVFLGAANIGHDEATRAAVRDRLHQHLDMAIATVVANPRGALTVLGAAVNMAINAAQSELRDEKRRAEQQRAAAAAVDPKAN